MRIGALSGIVLLVSGCAALQGHNAVIAKVEAARGSGGVSAAVEALDGAFLDKKGMLYNLERAELLREADRYDESIASLQKADAVVVEWEENVRKDTLKFLDNALATITSDRFRSYEGQDYEKVMLTTMLALNRLAVGDWDTARVDIRRTHEREDLIAKAKEKELEELKAKAKEDDMHLPGMNELGGYPVELIQNPEVNKLRNGYQNALSHYLSGFVYEALGEPDLAAVGYRRAIELQPGQSGLQDALASLDRRTARGTQNLTDVLFVIEAGNIPLRKSIPIILPLAMRKEKIPINFALPVIEADKKKIVLSNIRIGQNHAKLTPVVDFDLMARRSLRDELPSILLRGAIRMVVQGAVMGKLGQSGEKVAAAHQRQAQLQGSSSLNLAAPNMPSMPNVGAGAGVVGSVGASLLKDIATDLVIGLHQQVDDRMWRMLPERIYIARLRLAPGEYDVAMDGRSLPDKVSIGGRYAVVPVRAYSGAGSLTVHVGKAAAPGAAVTLKSVEPAEGVGPATAAGAAPTSTSLADKAPETVPAEVPVDSTKKKIRRPVKKP
jgi:hypothetical protein